MLYVVFDNLWLLSRDVEHLYLILLSVQPVNTSKMQTKAQVASENLRLADLAYQEHIKSLAGIIRNRKAF